MIRTQLSYRYSERQQQKKSWKKHGERQDLLWHATHAQFWKLLCRQKKLQSPTPAKSSKLLEGLYFEALLRTCGYGCTIPYCLTGSFTGSYRLTLVKKLTSKLM